MCGKLPGKCSVTAVDPPVVLQQSLGEEGGEGGEGRRRDQCVFLFTCEFAHLCLAGRIILSVVALRRFSVGNLLGPQGCWENLDKQNE